MSTITVVYDGSLQYPSASSDKKPFLNPYLHHFNVSPSWCSFCRTVHRFEAPTNPMEGPPRVG